MDKVREALYSALGYKPWPSQGEGHESSARFKYLGAGSRYGKSLWGCRDALPDILKENTMTWIVGPTYEQPSKEFKYVYADLVMKLGFKPSKELNVKYTSPGPQLLIFPWGAEVHTKSQENPESLLGEEIDILILSEGSRLKEETYDMYLRARLGTRQGRVIIPTTPHGFNWLYKRFYLPAMEGNPQYWAKDGIPVIENELFSKEEYERAREELPEDVFEEQYNGKHIAYSGLVYRRFRRQDNAIDAFDIPRHWIRYCAFDPHPQTPCAVLWLAIDEHDSIYIYDEMFIPNLTIHEIAMRVIEREGNDIIYKRLIDPNAKYIDKLRGQTTSVKMQFIKEGITCIEAINKFDPAYYKINELLTPRPVWNDEKVLKPRLFVFKNCKQTISEFETYTWEMEEKGEGGHMMDDLKYIINDNPVRTFTKEELEEIKKDEYDYLVTINPATGY